MFLEVHGHLLRKFWGIMLRGRTYLVCIGYQHQRRMSMCVAATRSLSINDEMEGRAFTCIQVTICFDLLGLCDTLLRITKVSF